MTFCVVQFSLSIIQSGLLSYILSTLKVHPLLVKSTASSLASRFVKSCSPAAVKSKYALPFTISQDHWSSDAPGAPHKSIISHRESVFTVIEYVAFPAVFLFTAIFTGTSNDVVFNKDILSALQ